MTLNDNNCRQRRDIVAVAGKDLMPPPRNRRFSTTLQYRWTLPSFLRMVCLRNIGFLARYPSQNCWKVAPVEKVGLVNN